VDELSVTGGNLGQGSFALDNVRLQGGQVRSGRGVSWVDEIKLMGDPGLPVYPNVMKFSLQWDQNGKIPWVGPLYSGYQDPATFCLVGDGQVASDIVSFLRAAQLAYDGQDLAAGNLGPFMPIFVQDYEYAADGRLGWTWDGRKADRFTQWGQFQYRAFAHLAMHYFVSGDAEARAILDDFHHWLADRWVVQNGRVISLPTTMITGTEDVMLGYRPGDFGLAAQGLLLMAARTGDNSYLVDAEALLATLALQQDSMGAFQTDGFRFGYEQAEVGIALALHELLFGRDEPDPLMGWLMRDGCPQLQVHRAFLPLIR
jgi:hypothetical protein